MAGASTLALSAALVATVGIIVARNRGIVWQQCLLRKQITAQRPGVSEIKFDADRKLVRFAPGPTLEGLSYVGDKQVDKMFQRAQGGGGFCPFTTRFGGVATTYLFHVKAADGGVAGWGLPENI